MKDALEKLRPFIKKNTVITKAPGRINLIGEHTDYNKGFVLPASIDKFIYVALTLRNDNQICLHSLDLNEHYNIQLEDLKISTVMWPNYILGVVDQFIHQGITISGFDLIFTGEIPMGGGLSSSAAIECSTAIALNERFDAQIENLNLAKMCQKAEHTYTGVQCGIMDQFASLFGLKDKVIKLDCRSLDFEYIPFEMKGIKIFLFDSNIKHSLASSEYNNRYQQCYEAVSLVSLRYPNVQSLRDVTLEMLEEFVKPKDHILFKRASYILEENERLLKGCDDLKKGDIKSFGKKMYESHEGLSKKYEVSCPELDYLVNLTKKYPSVIGSRMMGGGFGGCTINLIKTNETFANGHAQELPEITSELKKSYLNTMKRELTIHEVSIETGASILQSPKEKAIHET